MAHIHLMLNPKGGIGKSSLCSFLAEYFHSKDRKVHCIDTDITVGKFSAIKKFKVERFVVLDHQQRVDPMCFDRLMEVLISSAEDDYFVIDTGGSSYDAICSYIAENGVFEILEEAGHQLFIHTVIVGDDSYVSTSSGAEKLMANFTNVQFVLWLNPLQGKPITDPDGTPFQETELFEKVSATERLYSVISLPPLDPLTYGVNIRQLFASSKTFSEAQADSKLFTFMARARLQRIWDGISTQLEQSNL